MANGNIMGVELNLNQEYIKGAVEDIVKAGIIEALGDPGVIVKKAIDATINQKVDKSGKATNNTWDSQPYLNWLASKVVQDTVREAIMEYVTEHKHEFKAEVIRQLSDIKFKENTAEAFLKSLLDIAGATYRMGIKVDFSPPKN